MWWHQLSRLRNGKQGDENTFVIIPTRQMLSMPENSGLEWILRLCTSHLFPPPPHPLDMRGLCRAIAGELLQLCDDFMPGPPGTLPQICLTCLSIHTKQEHLIHLCDHKGRYTLHKHCASDALMLFFCLIINTQQEDLMHSFVTIKAGIH